MRRTRLYKVISVVALSALLLGGCASNTADSESYSQTTKEGVSGNITTQQTTQMSSYDIHSDTNYDTPANYLEPHDERLYGEATEIEYYSTVSHKYKNAYVILPYGYNSEQQYPVLYLLHGMGGDYRNWVVMGAQYIVQNAHYDYDAPDMIVVCPTVFTSEQYASEEGLSFYELTAQYDNFIDELENNLMPIINNNYSVKTGRENTAIAGYSLGGREASYIGFKYPTQFGYIGGFSATNGIFKDEEWAKGVLKDFDYTKLQNNYKLLLYQVGVEDPYIDGVREFTQMFDKYNIDYIYYEMAGGHEGPVWQNGLYNFARRIFR